MYSQSGVGGFGKINLDKLASSLPSDIKNILKISGEAVGITTLTKFFIDKGMSPEEAQSAAIQLIRGREAMPIMYEESFFEKKIFGIPIVALIGGGALLTFIVLRRR